VVNIIGVDPGSNATGYGIVCQKGSQLQCIDFGVIRPKTGLSLFERLAIIYDGILDAVKRYQVEEGAIEQAFHSLNSKTAIVLGEVRGVIALSLIHAGVKVEEYSPSQVKQAVVGYGRASKDQVQYMVKTILGLNKLPPKDAADALAIGLCHIQMRRFKASQKII